MYKKSNILMLGAVMAILLVSVFELKAQNSNSTIRIAPRYTPRTTLPNRTTVTRKPQVIIRQQTTQERIQTTFQGMVRERGLQPIYKVENGDFSQVQERVNLYGEARRKVTGKNSVTKTAVAAGLGLWIMNLIQSAEMPKRRH